jgi:hypothetical protein
MQLGKEKKQLPSFELPTKRGSLTVRDVLAIPPSIERDEAIQKWSASVWSAYENSHAEVATWLNRKL